MKLSGNHALVTGANRGIGASIVKKLSSLGANVSLLVRDKSSAANLVKSIPSQCFVCVADVTDHKSVSRACKDAEYELGPIDILVNNAGSVNPIPFLKSDIKSFTDMLDVHLLGPVHLIKILLPGMIERNYGRVINVASSSGVAGSAYVTHYSSAKHAIVGLTRSLALEYKNTGVTFNSVCPAFVDTDIVSQAVKKITEKTGRSNEDALMAMFSGTPQTRLIRSDEVAEIVAELSLPSSGERNGESVVIWGNDMQQVGGNE